MPQFDFYSFSEQNIFLIFSFFFVYFFILFVYLPNFAEVLKMRKKLKLYYSAQNLETSSINLLCVFYGILLKKKN